MPKLRISDRTLAFAITFTLAILLAIGIPLGIILTQKYVKPLPINVLVPFYVNPEEGAWRRLYDAIVKHPDTNFTVIVNPYNGPGSSAWPSATFIDAIKKLNVYPNVQTIGYVGTHGGKRNNATVRAEIAMYAGWSKVADGLALHGIYFDQTPFTDDEEGRAKAYLRNVSMTVRDSDGWAGHEKGMVVHNPGHVPDEGLLAYKPDLVVMFDGKYEDSPSRDVLHEQLVAAKGDRKDYAMFVNSVPKTMGRAGLRKMIERVRRDIEWLYLTDLTDDAWSGYASFWEEWLDVTW